MLSSICRRCPLFGGRKPLKRNESVGRPLATSAARNADAPGNRHHRNMVPDGQRNQAEAGVGDARHAGVRHQGHARAAFEIEHQFRGAGQFIVFVIADGAGCDAVVVQQLLRLPGIFAGNLVGFLEHAHRPQRDVFEIADGRGHQVESRRQRAFRVRARVISRLHAGESNIGYNAWSCRVYFASLAAFFASFAVKGFDSALARAKASNRRGRKGTRKGREESRLVESQPDMQHRPPVH